MPPRFEPRRLIERVLANVGAVFIWTVRRGPSIRSRSVHRPEVLTGCTRLRPCRAPQGIWDQIDVNVLPTMCSYNACGNCEKYGTFPCAWCASRCSRSVVPPRLACALTRARAPARRRYKILFIFVGLMGMFFCRSLYTDREVTYVKRGQPFMACADCGFRTNK